eukprot:TRINITY_DN1487_c4_g1_i1.p1 TRINITY_DN1487_c4_g1~~TRINITY_DN1487_c4_g1_i1.p1  ORF type:complete len:476 (-),score=74.54 TRINITY_DN1487_c4_g1_i1:60-1487(-)
MMKVLLLILISLIYTQLCQCAKINAASVVQVYEEAYSRGIVSSGLYIIPSYPMQSVNLRTWKQYGEVTVNHQAQNIWPQGLVGYKDLVYASDDDLLTSPCELVSTQRQIVAFVPQLLYPLEIHSVYTNRLLSGGVSGTRSFYLSWNESLVDSLIRDPLDYKNYTQRTSCIIPNNEVYVHILDLNNTDLFDRHKIELNSYEYPVSMTIDSVADSCLITTTQRLILVSLDTYTITDSFNITTTTTTTTSEIHTTYLSNEYFIVGNYPLIGYMTSYQITNGTMKKIIEYKEGGFIIDLVIDKYASALYTMSTLNSDYKLNTYSYDGLRIELVSPWKIPILLGIEVMWRNINLYQNGCGCVITGINNSLTTKLQVIVSINISTSSSICPELEYTTAFPEVLEPSEHVQWFETQEYSPDFDNIWIGVGIVALMGLMLSFIINCVMNYSKQPNKLTTEQVYEKILDADLYESEAESVFDNQ